MVVVENLQQPLASRG